MTETRRRKLRCLIVLTCLVTSSYQNSTLRERISIYLQELCPGAGVCFNDVIDTGSDETSCCGVCSCSDECGIDGNCCFKNQNKTSDDYAEQTTKQHRECLRPISNSDNNNDLYESYYMISSERTNFTVTCGDISVAPWGSMYPVYSTKTGEIYKNRACADAYNVTDGELWNAFMSCKHSRLQYDAASYVSGLQSGLIPEFCSIRFIFGGDESLVRSKICYHAEDYEGNCLTNFIRPTMTSASREEIVDACKSGLISPYKRKFANVFCYICQLKHDYREQKCSAVDKNKYFGQDATFTSIIDPNYIKKNVRVELNKTINPRIACRNNTNNNDQTDNACRIIPCPSGQTLNYEYKCIYIGNKWIIDKLYLHITLSSGMNFNISPVLDSVQNLKSPWPHNWVIDYIAYAATEVESQTKLMTVLQHTNFHSPFNPKTFFENAKKYIHKPWFLKSPNFGTVSLESKVSKHKTRQSEMKDETMPSMIGIYQNAKKKGNNFVTELYFCDHVTLSPSEFVSRRNMPPFDIILNKITNKTLFDGEFTIIENENGRHVEVCLSKSGFFRVSANNSTPHALQVSVLCIELMLLFQTFQIMINTVF